MDNIDVMILNLLQQNARMTVSEIGGSVNLSVPACSERLKKLESSGIIKKYTAILDPLRLEKKLMALMLVSLDRPEYTETFIDAISREEEILECHYIAGDHDYMLKIVTRDTSSLESLLNRIKGLHGVQKTRTTIVLSTIKNEYSVSIGKGN